ncbi:TPA: hypothetical protein DEB00_03570 [Candidatus Uhrbacteria bacterium]|nr:hypothetical protein [Candidatus Uhrbacteria bacterium]
MDVVPMCVVKSVSVVTHKQASLAEGNFRTAQFRIRLVDEHGRLRTRVGGYYKLIKAFGPSVGTPIQAAWTDYVYENA